MASGDTLDTSGEDLMMVLTREMGNVAQFFLAFPLG
jgi:hypothetical protein